MSVKSQGLSFSNSAKELSSLLSRFLSYKLLNVHNLARVCFYEGIPLLDGGTVRLPELIGLSRALDIILTGRPVNASQALSMGLANRVVQTGAGIHCLLLSNFSIHLACCNTFAAFH